MHNKWTCHFNPLDMQAGFLDNFTIDHENLFVKEKILKRFFTIYTLESCSWQLTSAIVA